MKHGKQYIPALPPKSMHRGIVGDCFDICLVNALTNPALRYVEGMAMNPKVEGEWILHAWLTDGEHAFDPTWKAFTEDNEEVPLPTYYIGFEMETPKVAAFVKATGYKSVVDNSWRNPELAKNALPTGFPLKTTA